VLARTGDEHERVVQIPSEIIIYIVLDRFLKGIES